MTKNDILNLREYDDVRETHSDTTDISLSSSPKKHELTGLFNSLKKAHTKALAKLIDLLDSEDDKIAMAAANAIIDFELRTSKEISTDSLQQLIANHRLLQVANNSRSNEPKDVTPIVNFSQIQDVK